MGMSQVADYFRPMLGRCRFCWAHVGPLATMFSRLLGTFHDGSLRRYCILLSVDLCIVYSYSMFCFICSLTVLLCVIKSIQPTPLVASGPEPCFVTSYQYRKSHCGDKTILRASYLHNGISYPGKTTSLYWIGALVATDNMRIVDPHDFSNVVSNVMGAGDLSKRITLGTLTYHLCAIKAYISIVPIVPIRVFGT